MVGMMAKTPLNAQFQKPLVTASDIYIYVYCTGTGAKIFVTQQVSEKNKKIAVVKGHLGM